MLKILNLKEAKQWSNKNLFHLETAIRNGLLMEIDKEHFAVVETENFGCTWVLDSIRKLSDEEMKENKYYLSEFCRFNSGGFS